MFCMPGRNASVNERASCARSLTVAFLPGVSCQSRSDGALLRDGNTERSAQPPTSPTLRYLGNTQKRENHLGRPRRGTGKTFTGLRVSNQVMKLRRPFSASLVFLSCLVPLSASILGQAKDSLNLSVKINDPYNPDFKFCTPVTVNEPFRISWTNGEVRSKISMILQRSVNDEYLLNFAMSEFVSKQNNLKDSWPDLKLKLDKPYVWGPISGFVYMRQVFLSTGACTKPEPGK